MLRRILVLATAVVAASALLIVPAQAHGYGRYLALGDSVAFGYRPNAGAAYLNAANFRGYAEMYAALRGLPLANASCPGETTGSMLSPNAVSNGCENGYRLAYPLHVSYPGTQIDYAVQYLRAHHDTRLVTLTIGANDLFRCRDTTPDHCTGPDFQAALDQVGRNLSAILAAVRANYHGDLVLVSYYALDYRDPAQVAQVKALDATLAGVTRHYRGAIADGFRAFFLASLPTGGDPCAAGLLVKLPAGGCDVHPSAAGHRVLAAALAVAAH